ncbi:hypothetical protein BDZ45DRAFT_682341 [Acephala macrosclerotiorum]|nr:hypothetical protein BDZ45DRAFT_682341 [Acephala macrosclerotiorum]
MKDGQTVLYENASRINHSCVANAIRTLTQEWHVIFWASKDIKNGEEITRNYGGAQGPAEHRQEKLKEDFSFVCVCEACIANDTLPCNRAEEDIEVVKMIEEKLKNGTPVTEIVKQRTPEQVEAEKTVKQWLLKIRLACNELAKQVTQSTIEACNQPGRDHKEAVQHALQNSRELWDKKIRDHSKIKHGDKCVKLEADVLSKYMMQFEYAFAEAMGKLTKAEEPLYMLAYFWRVVDGSLKYEFSGQKPPNDGRLWLHRPDAKLVIKGMEEKSAALKREASRNTPSSANDDHLADIPLAFPASKDEATLKGFTASNTAEPKGETTLKVSAPPDMATPTAKVVSKDSTNQDNLAAPKDSTDPNVAAPHDLAAPQDLANQDNLASPKDATAPNEAVPQDSASQGNFAAPKDGVVKDLAVSKDEVAPEGWTVPNMAAPKFEGTPKDEAVFKDLAASKDGVAPKGSTAPNMATPKGLAAPNVAAAKGEAAFKVLATPAMAAPKDSVALQDLADLFGLAS